MTAFSCACAGTHDARIRPPLPGWVTVAVVILAMDGVIHGSEE
ncbi:hypothetical protein ACPXA0_26540 [Escherichia coli]